MTTGPHTVLLVGAGAIEGAWAPVIKAVRARLSPSARTEDAATVALANLVINLRWFAHASVALPSNAGAAKSLGLLRKHRAALCTKIAEELACHEADGSLRLRQDFEVLWQDATRDCECAVVTTNWDRVIASWVTRTYDPGKEAWLHHLHGDRIEPASLLLPSEVAFEPYFEPDDRNGLLRKRRDILDAVERADRVLIYGLSFSALDAELLNIVGCAASLGASKVFEIVNPDCDVVARRLMATVDTDKHRILCPRFPRDEPYLATALEQRA